MEQPANNTTEYVDEVMAEVRRIKEELSARYNHDLRAMLRDARARQFQSGHPVVTRVPGSEEFVQVFE